MNSFKFIQQGSEDWHKARFGRFTASKLGCIISEPNKSGLYKLGKGAKTYIEQCTMEQIIQDKLSDYKSSAMIEGSENEIKAAKAYQIKNEVFAVSTGFWCFGEHSGASPDKLVGKYGGAEFKNPKLKAHTKYLTIQEPKELKAIEKDYFYQCHMCMLATGRKWWDFVSYCPHKNLPEHLHLFQIRINRSKEIIKQIIQCLKLATAYKLDLQKRWGVK